MTTILTVGHGNLSQDALLRNLLDAGVERVVDVRSRPYSRWHPHFNRRRIAEALTEAGIAYEWEPALGGKPEGPALHMAGGEPDYALIAQHPPFLDALDRLVATSAEASTAIMCAEGDPAGCHRTVLIVPLLVERGVTVRHLLKDGSVVDHAAMARLL
ncbi:MAG: DUF488 domain-containing protein [Chloroflexi bacterium]|nr:DUF488 domain-containing protein [Chloroflexota bacterium]MYD66396.1 DUF488 domain-containing protein [Chloroflexota bacterium]